MALQENTQSATCFLIGKLDSYTTVWSHSLRTYIANALMTVNKAKYRFSARDKLATDILEIPKGSIVRVEARLMGECGKLATKLWIEADEIEVLETPIRGIFA